jgi:hypothetical protein
MAPDSLGAYAMGPLHNHTSGSILVSAEAQAIRKSPQINPRQSISSSMRVLRASAMARSETGQINSECGVTRAEP